jgi:hypothetical protein
MVSVAVSSKQYQMGGALSRELRQVCLPVTNLQGNFQALLQLNHLLSGFVMRCALYV